MGRRIGRWVIMLSLLLVVSCDSPRPAPDPTATPTNPPATTSTFEPTAASTATLPPPPAATSTPEPAVTATAVAAADAIVAATATLPPPPTTAPPRPSATPSQPPVDTPPAGDHRSPTPDRPPLALIPPTPGTYVFPVQPAEVVNYGPYHHDYPATDIFCPIGSFFVAPTNGVVDYVSLHDIWDPQVDDPATRGGMSVAIIGDDGVRYYGSHLSSVKDGITPGVRVAAGQTLGRTGHSGDARNTDPHLHFGISPPTTPGDWKVRRGVISPYKYLRAWAAGTQLQPVLK